MLRQLCAAVQTPCVQCLSVRALFVARWKKRFVFQRTFRCVWTSSTMATSVRLLDVLARLLSRPRGSTALQIPIAPAFSALISWRTTAMVLSRGITLGASVHKMRSRTPCNKRVGSSCWSALWKIVGRRTACAGAGLCTRRCRCYRARRVSQPLHRHGLTRDTSVGREAHLHARARGSPGDGPGHVGHRRRGLVNRRIPVVGRHGRPLTSVHCPLARVRSVRQGHARPKREPRTGDRNRAAVIQCSS